MESSESFSEESQSTNLDLHTPSTGGIEELRARAEQERCRAEDLQRENAQLKADKQQLQADKAKYDQANSRIQVLEDKERRNKELFAQFQKQGSTARGH